MKSIIPHYRIVKADLPFWIVTDQGKQLSGNRVMHGDHKYAIKDPKWPTIANA